MIKVRKVVEVKEATAEGKVVAIFATMNVVDKDGDFTLPGFFGKQAVVMLPAHDWKSIPLGKGTISEVGDKAIAEIQMNLELQKAKDWLSALRFDLANGKPLTEWSYGFDVLPGGSSAGDGDTQGYRILRPTPDGQPGCKIYEVSPVLVGAGENTGTLSAKDATTPPPSDCDCDDDVKCCGGCKCAPPAPQEGAEGDVSKSLARFADQADAALAAVDALSKRGKSLADLRAKDGRAISAVNKERLGTLGASLAKAVACIAELVSSDSDAAAVKELLASEMLRFELFRNAQ